MTKLKLLWVITVLIIAPILGHSQSSRQLLNSIRELQAINRADTMVINVTIGDLVSVSFNPLPGRLYKITDADAINNPRSFPVYIFCDPEKYFGTGKAFIDIPGTFNLCPIIYNVTFDRIHEFYDPFRDIKARDLNSLTGGLLVEGNCIKAAIEFTYMCYAGGLPQWQYINWDGATVNFPDDISDLEYVSVKLEPSSILTLGGSGSDVSEGITTIYYGHLHPGAELRIGYGTILLWQDIGQHSVVEYGKWNIGRNQGLGEGCYYLSTGQHCIFTTGDSCVLDSNYITMGDNATLVLGNSANVTKPLVVGEKSKLQLGRDAEITGNIVINSCGSLVAGDSFTLTGNLSIEDFVYVTSIPDNTTWGSGTIRRDGSTLALTLNVLTSTTPDATTIKWAGNNTLTCTNSSISLTSFTGSLRSNCYYEFTAATGKTITFSDGSYFNMAGGSNFVCNGTNGDKIIFKTNSDATKMLEVLRANY